MLIYPQQNVIDYLLQIGAPPRITARESIVSITLTYPQQDVIYNLLQIGAPPERRGGGMVYIRLCGSYFVDRTLGYIHISTRATTTRAMRMSNLNLKRASRETQQEIPAIEKQKGKFSLVVMAKKVSTR